MLHTRTTATHTGTRTETLCNAPACSSATDHPDTAGWLWIEVINNRDVNAFCSPLCLALWAYTLTDPTAPPQSRYVALR